MPSCPTGPSCNYTSAQTDSAIAAGFATIDLSPYWTIAQLGAGGHHRCIGTRHSEQRAVLGRRADLQPPERQQRAAQFVRGGSIDSHLPEFRRHHPHRIGLLRPQRDLHAARNRSCDHGGPRRAQSVPVPDGGPGAGPHRRRAGTLLGPERGVELRGRRADELPNQQ